MCIAQPARVVAIDGGDAVIDVDGMRRRASLLRSPEVGVGEWALVAAGSVLRRLEPAEATELASLLRAARAATTTNLDGAISRYGGRRR
jgi:hydrogenase expression/formation protein HypC